MGNSNLVGPSKCVDPHYRYGLPLTLDPLTTAYVTCRVADDYGDYRIICQHSTSQYNLGM